MIVAIWGCGDNGDQPADDGLTVTTDDGVLHGTVEAGTTVFLGVPYAAPPVGDLRFKPPQPVTPWTTPLEADHAGAQCVQLLSLNPGAESEDCLYLNVWVPPNTAADAKLPVFEWIHGGAFIFGSGSDPYYDGAYLAKTFDVIVVTMNYRLGPFGFMALSALDQENVNYPTSGNYGIDDQFAAIQWVHRNIDAFGGDSANVTLAGESAGGYSACEHYANPRTHDLFARVISESGLCTGVEIAHERAVEIGTNYATLAGCDPADLACLRGKTTDEIKSAAGPAQSAVVAGGPLYGVESALFWPNVDLVSIPSPIADILDGPHDERAILLGTNLDEGTLFQTTLFAVPTTDEDGYRAALANRFAASDLDAIVTRYPFASFASGDAALAAVTNDWAFQCPARRLARSTSRHSMTYRYLFEQPFENATFKDAGVIHSAEIPFVFGNDDYPLGSAGASGQPTAQLVQTYWMSFVHGGDPNDGEQLTWPDFATSQGQLMHLKNAPDVGAGIDDNCDFWDGLATPSL
jgi:para-nitrobenzyl esterase